MGVCALESSGGSANMVLKNTVKFSYYHRSSFIISKLKSSALYGFFICVMYTFQWDENKQCILKT